MFFIDERYQFFRPLTSKYREQVIECLRLLYERLYSANADYGESLRREQLLEIFEEALARAPELDSDEGEAERRFKNEREQAAWILNLLLDHGWIEKRVDGATLRSAYPFSRLGRLFTQPLVEADNTRVRTRHRNTRNTLNALEGFVHRGEVHDLLDAFEYSERIISDFTDVIAELEERKRELVREVKAQVLVQQATDQFFDFMEKRFQPDVSVRLSADSVEKHRDAIARSIAKIKRKPTDFKRDAELKLRQLAPDMIAPGQSVLMFLLDTIETRMRNAAYIMLPALRRALQSFTKRADIIIRQLAYLNSQRDNDILAVCTHLRALEPARVAALLEGAAVHMSDVTLQLSDPAQIKLHNRRQRRVVNTRLQETQALSAEDQRDLLIQQLLDQAFLINNEALREYVKINLRKGRRISTADLPIDNAKDLLAAAHVIEAGAMDGRDLDYRFIVTATGRRTSNEYFTGFDEFFIELEDRQHDN